MATVSSIPTEILVLIFTYLQCFADLTSVAGVCKGWRNAVRLRLVPSEEQPRYPQLPWLLQRPGDGPASTASSFLSGTSRRISLPEDVRRARLFCGSHDGGWIAIAADFEGPYAFVNLLLQSSDSIPLPREFRSPGTRSETLDIRMVTLSDKPTAENCIAAALTMGGYPSIVFCRPHVDCHWVPPLMDTEPLEDILYHRGEVYQGFYAISRMDSLYVFLPRDVNDSMTLVMRQVLISFQPAVSIEMTGRFITRYLVECRGKLVLVVRYSDMATGTIAHRTLHFKLFEMELSPLPKGGHSAAWVELDSLDGRVIIVGRGCSRAYEAGNYKGFQGGSIYFVDDAMSSRVLHSMFVFSDVGMYSMGDTKIERPGLHACNSLARQRSRSEATEVELLRLIMFGQTTLPRDTTKQPLDDGGQPSSHFLYGSRDLIVRTLSNVPHATHLVTRNLKIVSENIDHVTNEARSSTLDSREQGVLETVASVWPLLCKPEGNYHPIWLLPPPADEWLLPPPADD